MFAFYIIARDYTDSLTGERFSFIVDADSPEQALAFAKIDILEFGSGRNSIESVIDADYFETLTR